MKTLLISILLIFSFISSANDCLILKEDIPVQAGGRVKPLYVLAKESVKFMTGKSKFNDEPVLQTFCKILFTESFESHKKLPILVEHVDTKKFLEMKEDQTYLPADELVLKKELIRAEIMKIKQSTPYKKDLNKLFARIDTYQKIMEKKSDLVFNLEADNWISLDTLDSVTVETIPALLESSKNDFITKHTDHYQLELTYVKSHIWSYALLTSLIGIFLTVLLKNMKAGVALAIITVLMQIAGMTLRVLISGRAPITNMYETVMFSGFGALVIALCLLLFKKDKIYLLAGLGYNILCLFMMMFANNMLSSSISPLVPVLRDNFWLSTHVTTIILSYAALALSWMVANITLFKMLAKKLTKKDYTYYQALMYNCIKVGIVLLAAGIILGGVWADYSWGRFWGWDPKETWSLIVLLFYMIIVHGRYTNWINTHRFVLMTAAGFMTVMMAWFGVNYILASGLHSYGFSEGGAIFLGTFFAIQTVIIIIAAKQKFKEV